MNIYIMRHGEASHYGRLDAERKLTEHGKKQSIQIAKWLKRQLGCFDYGLVSPYVRAQQTLETINTILPVTLVEVSQDLTPDGSVNLIIDRLNNLHHKQVNSILIISHLPLVGYLISDLCPSVSPPLFSTASVALVTLSPEGVGTYQWVQNVS